LEKIMDDSQVSLAKRDERRGAWKNMPLLSSTSTSAFEVQRMDVEAIRADVEARRMDIEAKI
jgi:hypothetical protein